MQSTASQTPRNLVLIYRESKMVEEIAEEVIEERKKGWVVPAASVEAMRAEDAELFKETFIAMHDYNMHGAVDVKTLSPAARVLFKIFKETMDANVRRYEAIKKRNQENGKKSKGRGRKTNAYR